MLFIPGNEVINFQSNSALGNALTKVFQDVIDYRDNLEYPRTMLDGSERRDYRIEKVFEYVETYMIPDFHAAVKKHAGFTVELYVTGGIRDQLTFAFAVDTSLGDVLSSREMQNRETGIASDFGSVLVDEKKVAKLASLSDAVDLTTGMLRDTTKTAFKKDIPVRMYFDANAAFLFSDFVPSAGKGIELFTAEEIAAIMCHEIGHIITIIEHMRTMYYYRDRTESAKVAFSKLKDKELIKAAATFATENAKELDKLAKTEFGNTPYFKTFKAAADTVTSKLISLDSGEESTTIIISDMMMFLIRLAVTIISASIYLIFLGTISAINGLAATIAKITNARQNQGHRYTTGDKLSDTTATGMNYIYIERWADEFVSRQGLGAELASALNKLNDFLPLAGFGMGIASESLRSSSVFANLCIFLNFVINEPLNFILNGVFSQSIYEEQYERVKRIRENTYAIFKNSDLDATTVDRYLRNIRLLDEQVEKAKASRNGAIIRFIGSAIKLWINPVAIADIVVDGNLERDYYKLQNQLDAMFNNPLFYHATRLERRLR